MNSLIYQPYIQSILSAKEKSNDADSVDGLWSYRNDENQFPVEPVKTDDDIWSYNSYYRKETTKETPKEIVRGKTVFKNDKIKVGNLQGFLDLLEEEGISVRVTSGIENRTTKSGKKSKHSTGDAIDITPIEGQTYADLDNAIKNSPKVLNYMIENGIGLIDETDPYTKLLTGATGDHYHISINDGYALRSRDKKFKKATV